MLEKTSSLKAVLSTLFICLFLASCMNLKVVEIGSEHYRVYRGDGSSSTLEEALASSRESTVTFLGESHNDMVAHYLEALILKQTWEPGLALSLEMFESDVQYVLDEYLDDHIREDQMLKSCRAWEYYETDYRAMIEFMKEKEGVVIAANAPRRYVNMVSRLGTESLEGLSALAKSYLPPLPYAEASTAYAEKFNNLMSQSMAGSAQAEVQEEDAGQAAQHQVQHTYQELTQQEQEQQEQEQQEPRQHGQIPAEVAAAESENEEDKEHEGKEVGENEAGGPVFDLAKNMQAQSLWDASMAYSITNYVQANPQNRVVHVNGSFHTAERMGIVDHLKSYNADISALVITIIAAEDIFSFDHEAMDDQGDYIIVTDASITRM